MERSTIFNGKIHYKWPCSIAMLVHQRVCFPCFPSHPNVKHNRYENVTPTSTLNCWIIYNNHMSHKKTYPIYHQKSHVEWLIPSYSITDPFPKCIKQFSMSHNVAISQVLEHLIPDLRRRKKKSAQAARSRGPQPRPPPSTRRSGGNSENAPGPGQKHGSLNVPIEHHPTIGYMVYKCLLDGYYFR